MSQAFNWRMPRARCASHCACARDGCASLRSFRSVLTSSRERSSLGASTARSSSSSSRRSARSRVSFHFSRLLVLLRTPFSFSFALFFLSFSHLSLFSFVIRLSLSFSFFSSDFYPFLIFPSQFLRHFGRLLFRSPSLL